MKVPVAKVGSQNSVSFVINVELKKNAHTGPKTRRVERKKMKVGVEVILHKVTIWDALQMSLMVKMGIRVALLK